MSVGEFLTAGMVVEARWTNSHAYYAEPAEVVRVNRSSVRVRVLDGYLKGREIPLPLIFANGWSQNNGSFTFDAVAHEARKARAARLDAKLAEILARKRDATKVANDLR
jgi:hypothetical protein